MITTPFKFNKHARRLKALKNALRYPSLLRRTLQISVEFLYVEGALKRIGIPKKSLNQLFNINKEIRLQNFTVREGNASYFELLAIATILANHSPKNLLEIGTFDGTTTLQMALNSPPNATIYTLDLPNDPTTTHLPILDAEVPFVLDRKKHLRKYMGTPIEKKVVQHFGDSAVYDFNKFTDNGPIDLCFIDASHTYDYVKSDTEKTLKILAPTGIILWHDFSPSCPDVYRYLDELSKTLPLIHIADTRLVLYCAGR